MPKQLTGISGVWTKSQVYSIQIRWMKYFLLLNCIHLYSFMNEWLQGLGHTPGILVRLLFFFFLSVCLVTSLKWSPCQAISRLCRLVRAHYVRGKCGQVWRRPEELVNTEKCVVHLGFTWLTFLVGFFFCFFFLRKKLHEWKQPLYTVPVKMACFDFLLLPHTN